VRGVRSNLSRARGAGHSRRHAPACHEQALEIAAQIAEGARVFQRTQRARSDFGASLYCANAPLT
jgi:hypothetical protein